MSNLSKRKILLIVESWGKGGTETYVRGLAESLVCNDIDVFVVLLSCDTSEDRPSFIDGVQVDVIPKAGLFKYFKKIKPDVVNLHLYASLLPVTLITKASRIPVVTTLHMPISAWGLRHRFYWRVAFRFSNIVLGVSAAVNSELLNLKNLYSSPLPGSVSDEFFSIQYKPIDDLFHVFAVGRLEKEKNWETLVKAISLLPDLHKEKVIVDFFGDGSMRESLAIMAKKLQVAVQFHGYTERNILIENLSHARLSVLPSKYEGLGLSALESMAAGVPTITADFQAAHDYIVNEKTGHMFLFGDHLQLSDLILWHIDNQSRSLDIGENGREHVSSHCASSNIKNNYLDIYKLFQ